MSLSRRFPRLLLVTVLLAATVGLGSVLAAAAPASSSVRTLTGTLPDGAAYKIEVPANWNHTLFLYSHGYVVPGSPNPAQDVGDPVTGGWLLSRGYALAGSSYASTGWAIQQALPDQINTLNVFDQLVGNPSRTIAWGHSLGGIITAGLIQRYPNRFDAALPMCGVLSGGVATWNTALDSAFAFKTLLAPSVAIVNITNPTGNLGIAESAAAAAQQTPQGRARLALTAALGDTPGWFAPLSPEPARTDYAGQQQNQFEWGTQVDFPFAFALRAELEARAGGNPSWNTGVDYTRDLARSADAAEVRALYRAAGLSLRRDLRTLNRTARISADPAAVRYLQQNIVFNGRLAMPVLTMHTTGDGLVVPENEQAYRQVVDRAGDSSLLRQIFVHRAGHCAFTPAETITAAKDLLQRLNTGRWGPRATNPSALNASASALGSGYNIFASGNQSVATPPAFVRFHPPVYLRPFDAGDPVIGDRHQKGDSHHEGRSKAGRHHRGQSSTVSSLRLLPNAVRRGIS
jgi:pimeloyl-ACP methyl ester carboxylesterase